MWSGRLGILQTEVAFFNRLQLRDQPRFVRAVEAFLAKKQVIGNGVDVDERIRTLVAAPACRLALNLVAEEYHRLDVVSVYGSRRDLQEAEGSTHADNCFSVSLVLEDLESGLRDGDSGDNVGYHEFAHVLDASDGMWDGVPPLLLEPQLRRRWIRTLAETLAVVRARVEGGKEEALRANAADNEPELFAYATEAFFETPRLLRQFYPDFYDLLGAFYRQKPDGLG